MLKILVIAIKTHTYDFVPTKKNKESRYAYGLTIGDMEDLLMSLNENDLFKGPVEDRDYPGEYLYVYKKLVLENILFYIKVKYKDGFVKILSFHEDGLL